MRLSLGLGFAALIEAYPGVSLQAKRRGVVCDGDLPILCVAISNLYQNSSTLKERIQQYLSLGCATTIAPLIKQLTRRGDRGWNGLCSIALRVEIWVDFIIVWL